jgi:1,4-dihydroxy-2-naphthoate octaprenyltransferase
VSTHRYTQGKEKMSKWWLATRPWSFTVSVVPVALGNVAAHLLRREGDDEWSLATLALTIAGALSVHAAANLTKYAPSICAITSILSLILK